jgi:hypothetical protein
MPLAIAQPESKSSETMDHLKWRYLELRERSSLPHKPSRCEASKEKAPDYSGAQTSWRWTKSIANPYQPTYSREQRN